MAGLRSARTERNIVEKKNRYLDNPHEGFDLLSKIIAAPKEKSIVEAELEELKKLINSDFMELSKRQNLPNEAEMFEKLKKAFTDLEDLAKFSSLANKNIVAVGGGFSSGKSRFINSLFREDILPVDTTPTTAIPSYLVKGEADGIFALNYFNSSSRIDVEAVKAISHAFNAAYNVSFSHIIKLLMIEKTHFQYDNLVILDTPGYSKSDSLISSGNTDEIVARGHLSQADHIIWVVDAPKGTLPDADISFLKSLDYNGEVFVVLNKADQRQKSEIPEIMETVKDKMQTANIKYSGMVAYNSLLKENNEIVGDSISDYLAKTNEKIKYKRIKQSFRDILQVFISYNEHELKKTKETLSYLNQLYLMQNDNLNEQDSEQLKKYIDSSKKNSRRIKSVLTDFEELNNNISGVVSQIIEKIQVKEENKRDIGVPGTLVINNEQEISGLYENMIMRGKVNRINSFGIFIDCGLKDSIMLDLQDVRQKYTDEPKTIFPQGIDCEIEILEINRIGKSIEVVVVPCGELLN